VKLVGLALNVAVAVCEEFITMVQVVEDVEHAPENPANVDPTDGAAVRETELPEE
jgi:hypothetical protein